MRHLILVLATFLQLTRPDGPTIWVNVDNIQYVSIDTDNKTLTKIKLVEGFVIVKEKPEDILRQIKTSN